ncbi:MAG: hypothetical protein ACFB16_18010 [Phormidesmis sp.]
MKTPPRQPLSSSSFEKPSSYPPEVSRRLRQVQKQAKKSSELPASPKLPTPKEVGQERSWSEGQGLISLNPFFWKLCLLSFCLHTALFGLPWPQVSLQRSLKKEEVSQAESDRLSDEALALNQPLSISTVSLPAASRSPNNSQQNSQKENLPTAVTESITEIDPPQTIQPTQAVVQPEQPPQVIDQPIEKPANKPAEQPPQLPETPTDSASLQLSDLSEPAVAEEALSTAALSSPLGNEADYGQVMPLSEEFPHLAGAQSGCYGLAGCHQLAGNYRQAAQQLIDQMEAQGYQLNERDDIEDTGHRVFEVIAPNEPEKIYYLNVFSPDVGSTVYVVTTDILNLEQLQQLTLN